MKYPEIDALYDIYCMHPSVQTDTRKLQKGDIFFALKGPSFDGNQFAKQALEMGAAFAVIDSPDAHTDERCILVHNALDTLQQLAKHHRQQFSIPFLAITGSNGKTTTKELINTVLQCKFRTYATQGNLNNHIGVPLTLLSIKNDAEIAIIEMGANHQKEIESYCRIALPTHGLITNVGKAHIEGFGSEAGIRKGKGELFDYIREAKGTIFRNADLDYLSEMAIGIGNQVTYGRANALYIGKPMMQGPLLQVAMLSRDSETLIPTHLVGAYNFPNVMAAVAVGRHFGISMDKIREAIAAYSPDNSRSQWLEVNGNKIILDAYNANPTSMRAAITNFAEAGLEKKMIWIGAMKEMGPDEEKEHRELVNLIKEYAWKEVLLVGNEFSGLTDGYRHFNTSSEALTWLQQNRPQNASILIKGSRGSKMELLLQALKD